MPISTNIGKADTHLRKQWKTFLASKPCSTGVDHEAIKSLTCNHNFSDHYDNVLLFCVAIRILGTCTISPSNSKHGSCLLSQAFQRWAQMNVHLTLYCHLSLHLDDYILFLGPTYGWHCNPYERHNGTLVKFKHNGHAGGELEATIMRSLSQGL